MTVPHVLIILPVTLVTAGALALVNFWLAMRVGRLRQAQKISVGHGAHEPLERRMRAQANFIEYVPMTLILIGVIELAAGSPAVLWVAAATLVAARVLHAIGMDGRLPLRAAGTIATMLVMVALAIWAIAIPLMTPRSGSAIVVEPATGG